MMKQLWSSRAFIFITGVVAVTAMCMTAAAAGLEFDHVWIVVTRDAPERAALEHAGLTISPNVNRNDGQGTASVSAEFFNGYIELMIAPDWMPKGTAIEILTARDDTKSPSFFIEPPVLAVKEEANRKIGANDPKRAAFEHPIGVERITAIQIIRPKAYQPVTAFTFLEKAGIFKVSEGTDWAIEITFDAGRKTQTKDLRPDLPLIIHY